MKEWLEHWLLWVSINSLGNWKGQGQQNIHSRIFMPKKKWREKWLLVGNCSVSLAIQNPYVFLLFFWEVNQICLRSLSWPQVVPYCSVCCNDKSGHGTLQEVSWKVRSGFYCWFIKVSDLLPHLLSWYHCDFFSCICTTEIHRERGIWELSF